MVDWAVVAKEKDRLHIEDLDALRKRAHDLADGIEERLAGGEVSAWCDDILNRYGPEGRSVAGLIRK